MKAGCTDCRHPRSFEGWLRFTLMELMAVLAIVGVAAAMLLPAVSGARRKAGRVKCGQHLRQIGVSVSTYADVFDGVAMPGKFSTTTGGNFNHWINYLYREHLPVRELYQCPAASTKEMFNPAGGDNAVKLAGYIMNIIPPGANKWIGAQIAGDLSRLQGWGTTERPLRLDRVAAPDRKLYIVDAVSEIADSHSGVNLFRRSDHGPLAKPPFGIVRWVGRRHDGGFNALLGDMHTEWLLESAHDQWAVNAQ